MSAYSVVVSPSALEDLRSIQAYIATKLESPAAAEKTVRQMLDEIGKLEFFPLRNRALAVLADGRELRRVKSGNYLALYTVTGDTVSVLAVIYGKSNIEKRISRLF